MTEPTEKMDYRGTLLLPKTSFPMRAGLAKREPETLALWKEERLYQRLREARNGRERYVLHDGPPYASGHIHLGHAVDKIQKDMIVRTRSMMGFDAPYVPGWDCHGMPIEIIVQREFRERGEQPDLGALRARCREFATEWVAIQREEFERLGGWGAWDDPYLTMSKSYESDIVEVFADLVEGGYIYRGLRPIHWCISPSCRTALAEAEIEYHDKESLSVTVVFPLLDDPKGVFEGAEPAGVLIWTTTPWTIPANRAVVAHRELEYVVVDTERGRMLYAAGRHEALAPRFERAEIVRTVVGAELDGLVFRHPLEERPSPMLFGEHVTLDEGTGVVHTAPGHGAEDFAIGRANDLEIYNPVGRDGIYVEGTPRYAGIDIWEANARVVEDLDDDGLLVASERVTHSYPHCWRCRQPVIFRTTVQWFLALEHEGLRTRALKAIDTARWIPESTHKRIRTMVENRPDWCLSRQRAWGVGIPAVYCEACDEPVIDAGFVRHVAALVREHGADHWFTAPVDAVVPAGLHCAECGEGATEFRREIEILDVWFDSGSSQRAVLEGRPELKFPADLYKEGPDQHRGWFNSSLILAVATRDAAPYETVLTHGWMVDAKGHAMHKSLGNVISPDEVVSKRGADILRLWTAANDFTRDGRFSWDAIDQISEAYRRVRNTFRFLLGNLGSAGAPDDALPYEERLDFDRWALAELERTSRAIIEAYQRYEFHAAYQLLVNYCTVSLSNIYLDGIKVRLYTQPASSPARRSATATLSEILDALVRLAAPILPFTAEEVWLLMNDGDEAASVHLEEFPAPAPERLEASFERDWATLIEARQSVTRELEGLRERKEIGSSLDAEVEIGAGDTARQAVLEAYRDALEEVFVTSHVIVQPADALADAPVSEEGFRTRVRPAGGEKCDRCWRYRGDLGTAPGHPTLCAECTTILS